MDYKRLGLNVRKFRLLMGMKQEELAEAVDCTGSHIGQVERGQGVPSLEMVVKIANSLHVSVDQLLLDSSECPELSLLHDAEQRVQKLPLPTRILACEMIGNLLDIIERAKE